MALERKSRSAVFSDKRKEETESLFLIIAIVSTSLSIAGSRQFAYSNSISGVPVLDLLSLVSILVLLRLLLWRDLRSTARRLPLAALITGTGLLTVSIIENGGLPNVHQLRLIVPPTLLLLALSCNASKVSDRVITLALWAPLVFALTLNTVSLVAGWPFQKDTQNLSLSDVMFPTHVRGDTFSLLLLGPFFAQLSRPARNRGLPPGTGIVIASLLILYGHTYSSHKATPFVFVVAIALIFSSRRQSSRFLKATVLLILNVLSLFIAPTIRDSADSLNLRSPESAPAPQVPNPSQASPPVPDAPSRSDSEGEVPLLQQFRLEGSELARLKTWGDLLTSLNSPVSIALGSKSSDQAAMLRACGGDPLEYPAGKCDLDNGEPILPDGSVRPPLAYAHNWIVTLVFNFGVLGFLVASLLLSLAVTRIRLCGTSTSLAVTTFLLGGFVSAYLFSPFVSLYFVVLAVTCAEPANSERSTHRRDLTETH